MSRAPQGAVQELLISPAASTTIARRVAACPRSVSVLPRTVDAPLEMHPVIESIEAKYEDIMRNHLSYLPQQARIYLLGDPVMFIGLKAIAISLKDELARSLDAEDVSAIMYRFGHSIGMGEAHRLLPRLGLETVEERLLAGPVWAAYAGFVRVRLLPGSKIVADKDFILFYEHPLNFEAQLWGQAGRVARAPICDFNRGYSSGWCSVATDMPLDAIEVMCEVSGDPVCRFVMFPASRYEEYLSRVDEFRAWRPPRMSRHHSPVS